MEKCLSDELNSVVDQAFIAGYLHWGFFNGFREKFREDLSSVGKTEGFKGCFDFNRELQRKTL